MIAISPDLARSMVRSTRGAPSMCDLQTRREVPSPEGFGRGDVVQFSGDGNRIALGCDARFCVWEKSATPRE